MLISGLPFIELRGAIPTGIALGLNPMLVFAIALGANIVLIPIMSSIRLTLRTHARTVRFASRVPTIRCLPGKVIPKSY